MEFRSFLEKVEWIKVMFVHANGTIQEDHMPKNIFYEIGASLLVL